MADQWEYTGRLLPSYYIGENVDILNKDGADGWELVAVDGGIAYMKRRLKC